MARPSPSHPEMTPGTFSGLGRESRGEEFNIYSKRGSAKDTKNPPNPAKENSASRHNEKKEGQAPLMPPARSGAGAGRQWHEQKQSGAGRRGASVFPVT